MTPLDRFRAKCTFDPGTGCVLWTAGTTSGQGNNLRYGAFWYEGRRWFAHRWSAKYIHNLDIDDKQVDHCCPDVPNALCVQHLQAVPPSVNRELQWLRVQKGFDGGEHYRPPEPAPPFVGLPFHIEPRWLRA